MVTMFQSAGAEATPQRKMSVHRQKIRITAKPCVHSKRFASRFLQRFRNAYECAACRLAFVISIFFSDNVEVSLSICIAGMHRSGTSMVAGVLNSAGVYLGEEADFLEANEGENADGFWEHFGFYALNEKLLEQLRAGWDAPWIPEGWENREDLSPFREEASLLIDRMRGLAGGDGRIHAPPSQSSSGDCCCRRPKL